MDKEKLLDKLNLTKGEFILRKKVDNSGDYEWVTYDLLDKYSWGANGIVYDISDPYNALLFKASKGNLIRDIEIKEKINNILNVGCSVTDMITILKDVSVLLDANIKNATQGTYIEKT